MELANIRMFEYEISNIMINYNKDFWKMIVIIWGYYLGHFLYLPFPLLLWEIWFVVSLSPFHNIFVLMPLELGFQFFSRQLKNFCGCLVEKLIFSFRRLVHFSIFLDLAHFALKLKNFCGCLVEKLPTHHSTFFIVQNTYTLHYALTISNVKYIILCA